MSGPARGGESQRAVRETMIAAGGYWRPLAAVARLLEELGEISELLAHDADSAELGGELADLWIITTALADQFLVDVAEPGTSNAGRGPSPAAGAPADAKSPPDPGALAEAAGPIARIVNHYDGPKVPRAGAPLPSLGVAIAQFHAALESCAGAHSVELASAVPEKIAAIHARGDIERFGRDNLDPSTAPLLEEVAAAVAAGALPSRLWAAPDLGAEPCGAGPRAAAARGALASFAKAARAERLEGLLVGGPSPVAASGPAAWLGALVASLDPAGSSASLHVDGGELAASPVTIAGSSRVYALFTAP